METTTKFCQMNHLNRNRIHSFFFYPHYHITEIWWKSGSFFVWESWACWKTEMLANFESPFPLGGSWYSLMPVDWIQSDLKALTCASAIVGKGVAEWQEITMRREGVCRILVELMCDFLSSHGGSDKWNMWQREVSGGVWKDKAKFWK